MAKLLACLCLFLLASCATPRTPASGALRIVTLNLYHDKDDWPARRVQIAEELKRTQPDVIALQEVLQHGTLENQAQWLASQLGYQWHFVSVDPAGNARRYGNAILSRGPVLEHGQRPLQPLEDGRVAGLVRIRVQGQPVNLYVVHLHWTDAGAAIRTRQVAGLMQYILDTAEGFPSVVAGDFNAAADAPELELLRRGFLDAYGTVHPGPDTHASSTLNLEYSAPRRIDHVFLQRQAFEPVESAILFTRPDAAGTWASDHFGLYARVRLVAGTR